MLGLSATCNYYLFNGRTDMRKQNESHNVDETIRHTLDSCYKLKNFCGYIYTDCYVAYNIFDDAEKHPGIVYICCWTHCCRLFVEALESDRSAMECIDEIGGLFQ